MKHSIIYLLFPVILLVGVGVCSDTIDQYSGQYENQIHALIDQMTLDEKVGQLAQLNLWSRNSDMELLTAEIRDGGIGSFMNAGDRSVKRTLQKAAVEETRLGIPILFGRDVIHGYRTIFPIPLGQAASWNPELIREANAVAAAEAYQMGIHLTFAPMMDLTRDPRWGRIAESPGEDPYLGSQIAVAMVQGFQGTDLSAPGTIAACAKHYVGYGAAEGGRDYNTTIISDNELRNIYLRPFHASVENGVASVMSAFNDLNGVPTSGNPYTLRTILRDEWQFDGFVISDWESVTEMIDHGFCADEREAALKGFKAGVDMEMVSESYLEYLPDLISEGLVDMSMLDEAVANILRIKFRLGLFENPYPPKDDSSILLNEEHLSVARKLAAESIVLLKNDENTLPLRDIRRLAVIGPLADSPQDQLGCWSMDGDAGDSVTPLAAVRDMLSDDAEIVYQKGLPEARSNETSLFPGAVEAAANSDAALLFLGENEFMSGESRCRAFLDLPGAQEDLIKAVAETGTPVILVIFAGRPLTFSSILPYVDAVLYAWQPGTMGGPALVDVITGKTVPAGKLPVTFPRSVGQIPLYYNHRSTGRPPFDEMLGIPLGTPEDPKDYVSYYLDADFTPQYPFGYGLSYTTFKYADLKISNPELTAGDILEVRVKVENTGRFDAEEIVQLYIQDRFASITRPVKELKGFLKIAIPAGESRQAAFNLTADDLGFWNNDRQFVTEPGEFKVMVGGSSADHDLLTADFLLKD